MIFSKDQSVFYNGDTCTIIEVSYLGVRVENDETGIRSFIRASETDKVLLAVDGEPKIKAVEHKMLPCKDAGMSISDLRARYILTKMRDSKKMANNNSAARERAADRHRANKALGIPKYKPETPIEVLREKNKAMSIRESSDDRKMKA